MYRDLEYMFDQPVVSQRLLLALISVKCLMAHVHTKLVFAQLQDVASIH